MELDGRTGAALEYPVNLILAGRRCLVVGGGSVAERKVSALLVSGAVVTLLSPDLTPQLALGASQGRFTHLAKEFENGDAAGYLLVMCATDSPDVNKQVAAEAKQSGALVNVADTPALCDFTLPARVQRGSLSIAVSTGGRSPALARELRNELAEKYGHEYADYLEIAGRLRREWQETCASIEERCQRWHEVKGFDPEVLELLRQGRKEEAEVRFRHDIGCSWTQS
jgi:precorrin-2 dehydrogenase / sirohydrochlorin ferrochelatase